MSDIKTTFNPPGKPITDLRQEDDTAVLVAFKTELYASGPSAGIAIGWVTGNRVIVSGYPHAQPFDQFQCWWPLPKVEFGE